MEENNLLVEHIDLKEETAIQSEANKALEAKRAESFKKYGLTALLFAIIYTFCLYKNHRGITYPIYMISLLLCLKHIRNKEGYSLIKDSNSNVGMGLFYVISLILLSIHRCLSMSMSLLILESIATFLLLFSFIVYLYVDTSKFDIASWMGCICITILKPVQHIFTPILDCIAFFKTNSGKMDEKKKNNIAAVLIGIIVAIPLLVIIMSLLYSADVVFAEMFRELTLSITLPNNFGDIIHVIVLGLIAFWFAYTIPSSLANKDLKIKASANGNANPIIAITFCGLIGIVYIIFSAIQVMFLFTRNLALPAGYTYAQYAHEGFYQLLIVCLLNIVLVSVCQRVFEETKVLKIILTCIAACTYVMIASSAMRMILYIGVYHLTFLRLLVLWFLIVLGLWLSFLIVSLYRIEFPVFRACMVAVTVAFIGFIYSNPEYQIVKYDMQFIEEEESGYKPVTNYILNWVSTDAVNAVKENDELLSSFETVIDNEYYGENHDGIRTFNFSYYNAYRIFDSKK